MHDDNRTLAGQFLEIIPLVMRVVAADLRRSDMTIDPAYFRLLNMLDHRAWSLGELAEKQAVSLPTMSNTISTLESRGWVARSRSPEDRRVVLVELTTAGRVALEAVRAKMLDRVASVLEPLTPAQRQELVSGLDSLRQVFSAALPEQEG